MTELGFKVHTTFVDQATMYSKYCGVPAQNIDACPSVGWIRDFADPQTVLYVPFWGPGIVPTNNSNWGQVNDPAINAAMDKASVVVGAAARAQAWANIDKMLVNDAVAVPEDFDAQPNVEGKQVRGNHGPLQRGRVGLLLQLAQVGVLSDPDRPEGPRSGPSGPGPPPPMLTFIVRRILWGILAMAIVIAITFVLFYVLPTANPAVLRAGRNASPKTIAYISAELGINKPIYTQFWDYVKNIVFHFNLGFSFYSDASVTV